MRRNGGATLPRNWGVECGGLYNRGEQTTIIDKVLFECIEYEIAFCTAHLDVSHKYDLDLSNIDGIGDQAELSVSEFLKPGEAGRILIKSGINGCCVGEMTLKIALSTSDGLVKVDETISLEL